MACVWFSFLGVSALAIAWSAEPPIAPAAASGIRIETRQIPGGGELYTYFKTAGDAQWDVPLVSVLRDNLGDADPENDELRGVWAFTYSRPPLFKRAIAAIPFFYRHTGRSRPSGPPPPLIDMAQPAKGTVPRLVGSMLQAWVLDPLGMRWRATTRAYRSRTGEYRAMNLWRTLDLLSEANLAAGGLSDAELERIKGRLILAHSPFGGLVDDRSAGRAWIHFQSTGAQARGHNWELLRQRAEDNQLYFEPIQETAPGPSFALLWMNAADAQADLHFDSKFLGITDPFRDSRVTRWKDYSETWQLDGRPARMLPLALYSLEYPRVPLLLVDFRDPGRPRRREMMKRAADDVASGVLGWNGIGNLTYFAAKMSWSFIHDRHGGALDREARVRAYVQLRQALLDDDRLNAGLRAELMRRIDQLAINPLDHAAGADADIARRQYAALLRNIDDGRLTALLAARRGQEADLLLHSAKVRYLRTALSVASFGIYRHRETETPEVLALVDLQRRINWHRRYLEDVLASGPRPEVVADMRAVRHSIDELTVLSAKLPETNQRNAQLVSAVLARIGGGTESAAAGQ